MKETFKPSVDGKVPSCPFCGFRDLCLWGRENPVTFQFVYYVTCGRCKAHGPECPSEKEAVLTWNMRYVSSFNATIEGAENRELVTPKSPNWDTGDLKP